MSEASGTETAVETEEATVIESKTEPMKTEVLTEEETLTEQEKRSEECTEITEETIITELEEKTVECVDDGNKSLADYKTQIVGQPNPFENDTPTEIDDRPIEDYVSEGEDRPGEGKHFKITKENLLNKLSYQLQYRFNG